MMHRCTNIKSTLVISACVQSTVAGASFKMSALSKNPGKLNHLFHNQKNCEAEEKSEFDMASVSVFSTIFKNFLVPINIW
jgi:hypothetical protein